MTTTATRHRQFASDLFHAFTGHTLRVGRIATHPSGTGWQVIVEPGNPESPIIDAMGEGLTKEQAEEVLDRLDNQVRARR